MKDLEDIAIIIFIAAAYLASVYFAVAALAPLRAYQAGLVAIDTYFQEDRHERNQRR